MPIDGKGIAYNAAEHDRIVINERTYMFRENVEIGSREYDFWREVALRTLYPVLLIQPAYNADGQIESNLTAVFVLIEEQDTVDELYSRLMGGH
jgi:hypothetical protein